MGKLPCFIWGVLFFILVPALSDSGCPPISLGEGSPLNPMSTKGENVTIYRVFITDGNLNGLNITWTRVPSALSYSAGRYKTNTTFTDNRANASIVLWNLMLVPDIGRYTVTACSNCTCNETTFELQIWPCDPDKLPQPLQLYNTLLIAEPSLSGPLPMYVKFHGISTNSFQFPIDWTYNGKDICYQDSTAHDTANFSCNSTNLGNCTFITNFYIYHPSHANSGNYTVQAIGSGVSSRKAIIYLDILNEPTIDSCKLTGHAKFECQVSNFSEYTEVVVVENDRILFNKSTKGVSFGCWPNAPDPSIATCTVNVSTSGHSGKLQYKLCVGYNSSVPHKTNLQCSHDIIISNTADTSNLKLGLIVGGTGLALLLLLILSVVSFMVCRRKKSSGRVSELHDANEASPLLSSGSKSCRHYLEDQTSNQGAPPTTGSFHGYSPCLSTPSASSTNEHLDYPHKDSDIRGVNAIWKTIRSGILEKEELVHIARVIGDWHKLARYLKLSDSDIAEIEENWHDYEEKVVQALWKWFQQQPTPPTRRSFVRIIEEQMKDTALAQDISNIIGTSSKFS